jgi:hypothetical protein
MVSAVSVETIFVLVVVDLVEYYFACPNGF